MTTPITDHQEGVNGDTANGKRKKISAGRKVVAGVFAFLSFISFGVAVLLAFGVSGLASSSDVQAQGRRRDCVTAYNADFTEVVRNRDALVADGLVAEARNDQVKLASLADDVAAANQAVRDLPPLDVAANKGYTLNGVRHPPCPSG